MSMAGRCRNGFRLVSLVAAAATLLAAWLPPGRACACGPVAPVTTIAAPPAPCPCCGTRPAADQPRRPCCPVPAKSAPVTGCGCAAQSSPANPEPAVPPPPTAGDDHSVQIAAAFASPAPGVAAPAGPPVAELAIQAAGPPPIDLIISLSRLTC